METVRYINDTHGFLFNLGHSQGKILIQQQ